MNFEPWELPFQKQINKTRWENTFSFIKFLGTRRPLSAILGSQGAGAAGGSLCGSESQLARQSCVTLGTPRVSDSVPSSVKEVMMVSISQHGCDDEANSYKCQEARLGEQKLPQDLTKRQMRSGHCHGKGPVPCGGEQFNNSMSFTHPALQHLECPQNGSATAGEGRLAQPNRRGSHVSTPAGLDPSWASPRATGPH